MLGREIATLVNADRPAGTHSAVFNAEGLASGVYVYRLDVVGADAPSRLMTETRNMLLLR
jgi:hypothetical protein